MVVMWLGEVTTTKKPRCGQQVVKYVTFNEGQTKINLNSMDCNLSREVYCKNLKKILLIKKSY